MLVMKNFFCFFVFFLWTVMQISHPLILLIFLMGMSLLVGGYLFLNLSLWAMNAVILIFLGGMMVLFLYISTLSNYEKMFLNINLMKLSGVAVFMAISTFSSFSLGHTLPASNLLEFSFLFKELQVGGLLFLVVYLLLSLFSVVKMAESFKGALTKHQ